MKTALLSALREPPTVGRFYMVPVVDLTWNGSRGAWPVAGPLHIDSDFFDFEHAHYHLDPRFFTKRQEAVAERSGNWKRAFTKDPKIKRADPVALAVGAEPLTSPFRPIPKGRPRLARRMCRSATWPAYAYGHCDPIIAINAHFEDATAIVRPDGRMLCPHRKFDLSQIPADADGLVTCPLHGLRVRCPQPPSGDS